MKTGDSRDEFGRDRFHCFDAETHMDGHYPSWYSGYDKYGAKKVHFIHSFVCSFVHSFIHSLYLTYILRVLATVEAIIAKICNFWTFLPVIQLIKMVY